MGLRIAVGTLFGRVEREKFPLILIILFCSIHNIVTAWLICLELDKIVALLQLILRVLVDLILHYLLTDVRSVWKTVGDTFSLEVQILFDGGFLQEFLGDVLCSFLLPSSA